MEMHPTTKKLLVEIEEFRRKMEMPATRFGQLAVNDGNFIRAIKQGRTPSLKTLDRVRLFMKTYKRKATA